MLLLSQVKGGTKITNVVNHAKKSLDSKEHRSIVWSGSGGGIQKTISCVEILKRDYPIHQVTKLCYRKVEEYWDPQLEALEQIVAIREIPCIHILLTLDEIDPTTVGYQFSQKSTTMWLDNVASKSSKKQSHHHQAGGKQSNRPGGKRNVPYKSDNKTKKN